MKNSLLKIAVMNAAVCAALVACTGNRDNNSDNSGAQNVGEDTPKFTAIGKTKEEVEKAGFKFDDFKSISVSDSKNVKFDDRLVKGFNTSSLMKVDLGNGLTETIENDVTITERSENLLKKEANITVTLDGSTGTGNKTETCTRVEKSVGEGENKSTTASISCKVDKSTYNILSFENTLRKYSTYESCSVQATPENTKNVTSEAIYGTYQLSSGAVVKAVKHIFKLSGNIKCFQKNLFSGSDNDDVAGTDSGTGTSVTVMIGTPDMPSVNSIENDVYPGNTNIYLYGDTKLDNGKILSRTTIETLK